VVRTDQFVLLKKKKSVLAPPNTGKGTLGFQKKSIK